MKRINKVTITIISIIMVISVISSTSITAFASRNTITSNYITTIFKVHNSNYNNSNANAPHNIGGISAGTANNRLFVVKSNSEETLTTFYYYDNIYNPKYATEEKTPRRIFFPNGILGHANSMTVDDDYVYVACWQNSSNQTQMSVIARIARAYISSIPDKSVVTVVSANSTSDPNKKYGYVTINGTSTKICETYTVKNNDNTAYNRSISQIARYTYNSTTGVTKFIITYGSLNTSRFYTIATLQNNEITVVKNANFEVTFNEFNPNYITAQDIFYDSSYGLFLLFWGHNATHNLGSKLSNYVVRYNISSLDSNGNSTTGAIAPSKYVKIQGDSSKYNQYELESLAFIKKDKDKNLLSKPMFVFSSNNVGTSSTSGGNVDSIEKITYTTANNGVVDLYANIWYNN